MRTRAHYDTLGVSPEASQGDIKKAFRSRAKACHPDHHPGDKEKEAEFIRLSKAYDVLNDPDTRRHYDETGEDPAGERNVLAEVYGLIINTFTRIRDREGDNIFFGDPLGRMKTIFAETVIEAKGHIEKLQARNKQNEKLMKKLTHKGGAGSSFLHMALAGEIQDNERQIAQTGREIEVLQKAGEVVLEYSFAADKRTENVNYKRGVWRTPFFDDSAFSAEFMKQFDPFRDMRSKG